ncbi:MAG TPA: DmsC/YnfH family molybdoenzyme membrane anchor subunit [Opitutaceae bacterium]|nr:DmsC/YnfH family molybdoenzyme membrane anchor subunit [Opitutaceae bacterium]
MSTEDSTPRPRANAFSDSTRTLIDDYLAEQQRLQTPVRRFADAHHAGTTLEPTWRDLIPLSAPQPGEQYAFEVDLDACTGCKACVAGCHSLNGLDDEETWRDVGVVFGGSRSQPFQQTVTTACHHCEDPGCLNGCPVLAYEKDPITGIVRHLDDQCIGCQYCVLKCPYDVPKYSERLGIVRKCDMCHNRLSAGEAPACVQACPTQAIRIVTVLTSDAGGRNDGDNPDAFLPAAPSPKYTRPTTRYVSKKVWPENANAADAAKLRPQPPHWPLVFMLTLAPMSLGCFAFDLLQAKNGGVGGSVLALMGWVTGAMGLAGSVFHLGQPLRAWRVFLGLRRSWLSREAVLFGIWFGIATTYTTSRMGYVFPQQVFQLGLTAVAVGAAALFCSVMIYADTPRPFWRFGQTAPRFFGTVLVLGSVSALGCGHSSLVVGAALAGIALKLAVETRCFQALDDDDNELSPERLSAEVLAGPLRFVTAYRYMSALAVACTVLFGLRSGASLQSFAFWATLLLSLSSELTERYLFFRAVFAPKMPGVA